MMYLIELDLGTTDFTMRVICAKHQNVSNSQQHDRHHLVLM